MAKTAAIAVIWRAARAVSFGGELVRAFVLGIDRKRIERGGAERRGRRAGLGVLARRVGEVLNHAAALCAVAARRAAMAR